MEHDEFMEGILSIGSKPYWSTFVSKVYKWSCRGWALVGCAQSCHCCDPCLHSVGSPKSPWHILTFVSSPQWANSQLLWLEALSIPPPLGQHLYIFPLILASWLKRIYLTQPVGARWGIFLQLKIPCCFFSGLLPYLYAFTIVLFPVGFSFTALFDVTLCL